MTEIDDVLVTRAAYDAVAELYTNMFKRQLDSNPFDRAMLDVFTESVSETEPGMVADIGCGPGRVTTYLKAAGLNVFGIDLSPEMIRQARAAHPDIHFEEGSMERMSLDDAALSGIVAWYSIIHTPPERVPAVLTEFARVLRPEGHILFGFQASEEPRGVQAYEHKVAPGYRWAPDTLAEVLEETGFRVTARMLRAPRPDDRGPQGYVLAVRN
ncbi:class I SAM-dependent methyltransferase [Nocardia sp. NPDC006630]|uniref:class I SAM-dependent methyltransferase n=1 Tax=Nocardia sp. NPDC006630 TaxID=3157181 RepID=UPI0033B2D365